MSSVTCNGGLQNGGNRVLPRNKMPYRMNLFLASYRFKKPLLEVTAAALPMLGVLGLGVVLITYIPWMTTALLGVLGKM